MTTIALIVGAIGVTLIYAAITNENPLAQAQFALSGKVTSTAKGFKQPKGYTTPGTNGTLLSA